MPGFLASTCTKLGHEVKLEPVKSAEPPKNSGKTIAKAVIAFCEALRVEMPSAFSLVAAINASAAAFQCAGKSPAVRRKNSAASAGKATL